MTTRTVNLCWYKRHKITAFLCGVPLCLALGNMDAPARAGLEFPDPVEAQISLEGSPKMMLGEPIVLRYRIANVSNGQGVGIDLGVYKTQWCRLSLTDANGHSAQVISDSRPLNPRGFHSTGVYFLPPNGFEEDSLVVTRFFQVLHPGKYVLALHVSVPYTVEAATEEASLTSDLEGDIKASKKVVTDDLVFPITISEASPSLLKAKAASLRQSIVAEKDSRRYKALLDALFSMPEAQAKTSWASLATDANKTDAELIADRLARVHSITAANLLVQMLDNPTLSPDNASYIKAKIDESYNAGDALVQSHLKALAASRGGTMPEKVAMPQPSD